MPNCHREQPVPDLAPIAAAEASAAPAELAWIAEAERNIIAMAIGKDAQTGLLSHRAQHRETTQLSRQIATHAAKIRSRKDTLPPMPGHFIVGDGWGCTRLQDDSQYCWQAPGTERTPNFVWAHHIAQFDGPRWVGAEPDRACTVEWQGQNDGARLGDVPTGSRLPCSNADRKNFMRCWPAPDFIRQLHPAPPNQGIAKVGSWTVALPDDVDGVLGSIDALCDRASYDAWLESPRLCRRNLGLRLCRLGSAVVPCALVDADTLKRFLPKYVAAGDHTGGAIAGDLFTCKADRDSGIWCIGASRDGFFGSREECPAELLSAWPTLGGPVVAPNAKCARFPVKIGNGRYRGVIGSAGPRGLCLERELDAWHTEFECFGAIRLPPTRMVRLVVGLGDEPSACGMTEAGELFCWGAGYNLNPSTSAPIPIRFDLPEHALAIDSDGPFHVACGIHHRCGRVLRALPNCPAQQSSYTIDELLGLVEGFEGQRVTVRGAIVLHPVTSHGLASIACGPFKQGGKATPDLKKGGGYDAFCCPAQGNASVSITNGTDELYLDGFFCGGDSSRSCCSIPVLGQEVQVTGMLRCEGAFSLADPEICQTVRDIYQ